MALGQSMPAAMCRHRTGTAHHEGLRAAEPEHLAAHRHHARKGEFQAEREQQEHHADLGDGVRLRAAPATLRTHTDRGAMPTIR